MTAKVLARPRALLLAALMLLALGASPASASTISGAMFEDADRDGIRDAGEPGWSGRLVYLFDASGTRRIAYTSTDAGGAYAFAGLADGAYRVETDYEDWLGIRQEWVPTTTGSVWPRADVQLFGARTVDFGWRRIVRSASPLTSFTGPSGVRVESYDDAVTAREVHDALARGTLVGPEAATVTIRFDHGSSPITLTSVEGGPGSYANYRAEVRIPWLSWLDQGDRVLFHEYGHAWSLYYAYTARQDTSLAGYLQARGISPSDPRLDTSHAWSRREMIAEDYRQLFAPASAAGGQENGEIPAASAVPGLREYLAGAFREPAAADPDPEPDPQPAPAPAPALQLTALQMNPLTVKATGTASLRISAAATVTLAVRDAKGGLVRTLLDRVPRQAGDVSALWDRKNAAGQRVKAGTYLLAAQATDAAGATVTGQSTFKVG